MADCWLQLDKTLSRKLFRPDPKANPPTTRLDLAAAEAMRVKKCLGSLRYLWRNSNKASHNPELQELKDLCCPSPTQLHNRLNAVNLKNKDDEDEDDIDDVIARARAIVLAAKAKDDESEDEESRHGEVEKEDGEVGPGEEKEGEECVDGSPLSPSCNGFSSEDEAVGMNEEAAKGDVSDDGGSGSDESILKAPTLRLGGSSPEPVDSQVRPEGWLGGFYNKWKTAYGKDLEPATKEDDIRHPVSTRLIYTFHCEPKPVRDAIAGLNKLIQGDRAVELATCLVDVFNELKSVQDGEDTLGE